MSSVIQVSQVYYPESDGKPMGETDDHRKEMVRHIELLEDFYQGQEVYVSGDLLVYYVQGNPRKYVVPDAFVVKGVVPKARRVYKIWVEGQAPDVVIETTSRKTRRKDTADKPELYARLGVKEYFLFDPHQEYLDPPLQGHRLAGDGYEEILAGFLSLDGRPGPTTLIGDSGQASAAPVPAGRGSAITAEWRASRRPPERSRGFSTGGAARDSRRGCGRSDSGTSRSISRDTGREA